LVAPWPFSTAAENSITHGRTGISDKLPEVPATCLGRLGGCQSSEDLPGRLDLRGRRSVGRSTARRFELTRAAHTSTTYRNRDKPGRPPRLQLRRQARRCGYRREAIRRRRHERCQRLRAHNARKRPAFADPVRSCRHLLRRPPVGDGACGHPEDPRCASHRHSRRLGPTSSPDKLRVTDLLDIPYQHSVVSRNLPYTLST